MSYVPGGIENPAGAYGEPPYFLPGGLAHPVGIANQILTPDPTTPSQTKWAFLSALGFLINARDYGVVADGVVLRDVAIGAGSQSLSSASAVFTTSDVGKLIQVRGAGTAGASFHTTISARVDANNVTLAAAATTAVSAATAVYATNDTAAILAAVAAAATKGYGVTLPGGVMGVTPFTIPADVVVTGKSPRRYSGAPDKGSVLASVSSSASPLVSLTGRNTLHRLGVLGSTAQTAVSANSTTNTLDQCVIWGGANNVDGNYSTMLITGCTISSASNHGITAIRDSLVTGNYIFSNGSAGIDLPSGANDVSIVGNKIEWNLGCNIRAFDSRDFTIVANVVDRSGASGMRFVSCDYFTVTGNVVRRSGRTSSGTESEDTHFHVEGCTNFIIVGNPTRHGADDDNTGYDSPLHALYLAGTNIDGIIGNNGLKGCTGTNTKDVSTATNVKKANNLTTDIETINSTRVRVDSGSQFSNVANAATVTWVFNLVPIATFFVGQFYRAQIVARNTSSGTRQACWVDILVSREGGNASVAITVINSVGTSFGAGSGTYSLAATCASDGSTVSLAVTNGSASAITFSAAVSGA